MGAEAAKKAADAEAAKKAAEKLAENLKIAAKMADQAKPEGEPSEAEKVAENQGPTTSVPVQTFQSRVRQPHRAPSRPVTGSRVIPSSASVPVTPYPDAPAVTGAALGSTGTSTTKPTASTPTTASEGTKKKNPKPTRAGPDGKPGKDLGNTGTSASPHEEPSGPGLPLENHNQDLEEVPSASGASAQKKTNAHRTAKVSNGKSSWKTLDNACGGYATQVVSVAAFSFFILLVLGVWWWM